MHTNLILMHHKAYTSSILKDKINSLWKISDETMLLLCSIATARKLVKKAYLLKEGQTCKHIYFIETGCLRSACDKDGVEINLNFTLENNFVTALKSLRNETASEIFIQATEPTFVYEFDKTELFSLYEQSAEITLLGRNLLETLLFEQEEHSSIFKIQTPKQRYEYLQKYKPELLQRVSLSQLASYLGISRETLSRLRK